MEVFAIMYVLIKGYRNVYEDHQKDKRNEKLWGTEQVASDTISELTLSVFLWGSLPFRGINPLINSSISVHNL